MEEHTPVIRIEMNQAGIVSSYIQAGEQSSRSQKIGVDIESQGLVTRGDTWMG
jgi:hypothetical protein